MLLLCKIQNFALKNNYFHCLYFANSKKSKCTYSALENIIISIDTTLQFCGHFALNSKKNKCPYFALKYNYFHCHYFAKFKKKAKISLLCSENIYFHCHYSANYNYFTENHLPFKSNRRFHQIIDTTLPN